MLLVHTQEITAEFAGFPLSVSVQPTYSDGQTKTVVIDAAERHDGACAQRLTITGSTEDMRRVFREALAYLEVGS